ncbi:LacI family DNA-binding transcriptional regulator [Salisediminibacterium selenitireducens]|uniref:Transcriptional regulator, LacI family n=1 Tax=Bacillus selenitireducens (strain ATCC 700615 / DSM 15326 / MLS10) TaxID=439292 RepID=D6XVJ9_BACIE|nr:LacI family DNA-binding transcriptional regulator [Salisediminibacterium selenitireducens]ADH99737.1 transcriptional regulator, LacI family [[Bacillus] selenitireducens MLS10]
MATIKDIAKEAGVSVTSVSRVLNNRGYLSEALKNNVYSAMARLDYRPNEMARALQKQKTSLIGVIVPDVSHPFFAQWTKAVEQRLSEAGYKLILCNSHYEAEKEQDYVDMLRGSRVDGLLFASHTNVVYDASTLDQPVVSFERVLGDRVPTVSSDHWQGGELAAAHLVERGCRHVLMTGGHPKTAVAGEIRYEAAKRYFDRHGVTYRHIYGDTHILKLDHVKDDVADALRDGTFDGVFAGSDLLASMVLQTAFEQSIRVPEALKIVGYDGTASTAYAPFPLTTVLQPVEELAETCVALLIAQIEGKEPDTRTEPLPVTLRQGMTT